MRLQRILVFKELGMSLNRIAEVLETTAVIRSWRSTSTCTASDTIVDREE